MIVDFTPFIPILPIWPSLGICPLSFQTCSNQIQIYKKNLKAEQYKPTKLSKQTNKQCGTQENRPCPWPGQHTRDDCCGDLSEPVLRAWGQDSCYSPPSFTPTAIKRESSAPLLGKTIELALVMSVRGTWIWKPENRTGPALWGRLHWLS